MHPKIETLDKILNFAAGNDAIRLVGMEGSRVNVNVPRDDLQDYDVTFVVTDAALDSFTEDDAWLDVFGERVIMQKPEAMALFSPEHDWLFSFLMIFTDGVKIDLSIVPLASLSKYLASDKLLKILLDKDGLVSPTPSPTDRDYWISAPTPAFFDDCCNEFWLVSTYIMKGILRKEILFAAWHMERIARPQLFTMLSWKIGSRHGYNFSIGKHNKYIKKYLLPDEWKMLAKTYRMDNLKSCRAAMEAALALFRQTSKYVAEKFGFKYPNYDEKVTDFIKSFTFPRKKE